MSSTARRSPRWWPYILKTGEHPLIRPSPAPRGRPRRSGGRRPPPSGSPTPSLHRSAAAHFELGGVVLPGAVQRRVDGLTDGSRCVGLSGASENTKASSSSSTPIGCPGRTTIPMLGEHHDRLGIERDAPLLVGLGVLLPDLAAVLGDRPAQGQHGAGQVDARPPQPAHFAAPGLPVVRASEIGTPQSRSRRHASFKIFVASAADGGPGSGLGARGGSA